MVDKRYEDFLVEHLRTQNIRHSGRTFFTHLKGVHDLLRDWGAAEPVCVAGLFHSIYGTNSFRHQALLLKERSKLQALIGPEAESLVYVFCTSNRPATWFDGSLDGRPELPKLLEIEAANLIEQGDRSPVLGKLLRCGVSGMACAHISAYLANR